MSKNFTCCLFMLIFLTAGSSLVAQNTALSLNSGTSDHATTLPNTRPIGGFGNAFTMEMWVYIPSSPAQSGIRYIASQGSSGVTTGIAYDGSTQKFYMGDLWDSAEKITVPLDQWNHISLVADLGQGNAWFYLNGKAVDSIVDNSYYVLSGSGTQLQLGTDPDSTSFLTGKIDQFRVWETMRTASQVKTGMYTPVDSATAGLDVDYLFDANPGVTHNSGALGNVDLTLVGSATTANSPVQPGNNGLKFSSAAVSQVTAPAIPAFGSLTTGTLEAWVNPNTVNGTIFAIRDASNARFSLHLNNTSGAAVFDYVGLYNNVNGFGSVTNASGTPQGFPAGTWTHLAFVTAPGASGDTTGVFVNGNYLGNIGFGYNTGAPGTLPLTIGGNGNNGELFDGSIDEVRIWNVARTPAQIQAAMSSTLTGNEPGLVALYSFDQGIADGDNTGLKVAVDNAPQTNNGTLSNFALTTSSASNFTLHTLVPLPLTLLQFTVTKQNNTALLQWQTGQEENTNDFIIERSGDGKTFTDIGSVAAAGTSHVKLNYYFTDGDPLEGINYYRLRERDLDGKATYSPVRSLAFTKAGNNLIWYTQPGSAAVEIRLQNGSNELYTISNTSGSTVRTGRLSSGVTNLSQVPAGVYIVKVITNAGNTLTTKVLVK
jgi:hypothetical protein